MNQLNRKLIREFWHAKGLLLAITLMIALGVMCLVTMQSAYRNLLAAKIDYYHQCQMAHFWIDLKKVALSDIPDLSKYPSIRTLDSRLSFPATLDWHLKPEPLNCKVVSLPDRPKNHLCKIILHRGTYFTERNSNEVILSTKFAESNEIQPGDSVHLLLNNRREEFTVVGTAYSSEFTYMTPPGELLPSPENYGICYLKRSYAEELFDFQAAANQLLGEFHPLPDSSKYRLLEDLKQELEPYGLIRGTLLKDQTSNQFLTNEIQGVASFSFFLPTVFLTVAALVLNVLMTRLAKRQRVVIGTFKALGYTDGQLFLYFLKFGFVVGVAGSLCGSFFGILLAGGMTALYGYFFEFPNLISEVFWYPHFIGLVASLFCSVLGSIFGARHSLKLQPAEAMRAEAPIQGGHIWLERLSSFWQALSPSWRLALRSLFRARLRSLSNFIAAMMGTAILSSGLLMTSSQVFFIDFQFDKTMRSDVDLALKNIQGRQVVDEVLDLPGVYYAEPSYLYGCT
ncbi:MAG: ABC transporter permease, partial [Pirellulaceae bacterium]|nr:ABC transporter permease [Pirellulaceae bacterium]